MQCRQESFSWRQPTWTTMKNILCEGQYIISVVDWVIISTSEISTMSEIWGNINSKSKKWKRRFTYSTVKHGAIL